MLGDAKKDIDEELADNFLQSPYPKEWRIWKLKGNDDLPLDIATYSTLIQRFPKIPEIEVNGLDLFERNDTATTTRSKLHFGTVCLPALELRFQDPEHPWVIYIGFIEGRENLNKFLKAFIKKYNEQYPFEGITERVKQS